MRLRRLAVVLLSVVAGSGLASCGDGAEEVERELLNAITATRREPYKFAYVDEDLSNVRVSVNGLVEDDYRYKARFSANDTPLWDEVVSDDAVADRFLDPDALQRYGIDTVRRQVEAATAGSSEGSNQAAARALAALESALAAAPKSFAEMLQTVPPDRLPAMKALAERRWVLDPVGAPVLAVAANDPRLQGQDPFFDALTTLDLAFKAVQAADQVKRYDEDALEPVYKPSEDPFPKPEKDGGVVRYDLKEPKLPSSANASAGAVRQVPPPRDVHFRKMAIYVKDGRVVEVREVIDVQWKLKDLARNYRIEFPKGASAKEQVLFAVGRINELSLGASGKPLRPRQMVLQLRDIGNRSIEVDLPTANVVEASLAGLGFNRGRTSPNERRPQTPGQIGGPSATTNPAGTAGTGTATTGDDTTATTGAVEPQG